MRDTKLASMPATEMARLVQSKELSPVDLVQAALARIDEVNPALNCFCFSYPEEALEKARAAEDEMTDFPGRSLAAWKRNWR